MPGTAAAFGTYPFYPLFTSSPILSHSRSSSLACAFSAMNNWRPHRLPLRTPCPQKREPPSKAFLPVPATQLCRAVPSCVRVRSEFSVGMPTPPSLFQLWGAQVDCSSDRYPTPSSFFVLLRLLDPENPASWTRNSPSGEGDMFLVLSAS